MKSPTRRVPVVGSARESRNPFDMAGNGGETGYSAEAAMAMLLFSLASSSLLLINKLCLHYFPVPAFVSTLQFISASATSMVSVHVFRT